MKVKSVEVELRKDGYHYYKGRKIKAYYPREGWGVAVEFENSPVDKDFEANIWFPSEDELKQIAEKMRESDEKTWRLRGGKGWTNGPRPFTKLHEWI